MAKRKTKKVDPVLGVEPSHNVFVRYNLSAYVGRISPGQENDAWPSREPEFRSHEVVGVFIEEKHGCYGHSYNERTGVDFKPITGMTVHLVLVIYQTGDTFGYSTGNVSVVGVYRSAKQAEDVAKSIRNNTYPGYKCWDGYFERLEHVEVSKQVLDESQGVRRF